jgi:hypothetical protein
MEEGLYNRYYTGWHRELVRTCQIDDYKRFFDRAFGSDKITTDWNIQCLRHGLPFNMGSKAETFCIEDFDENIVGPILELFRDNQVPMIIETKSHYVGLKRYLDILKDMNVAVIVAIMGGSDTLNYTLEPGAPMASMRWALVKELNQKGIWTGVRWEPILAGINSKDDQLEGYAEMAQRTGAQHVSFFNYRTSNVKIAQVEFEKRGYNYPKLLKGNLDENWRLIGEKFFDILKDKGVKGSTPDIINFPFDNYCESCCGVDELFPIYEFTLQHACKLILQKGSVCWDDMEEISFREPEAYERLKKYWNGGGQYYTLKDSPKIGILEVDKKGKNVYGIKSGVDYKKPRGLGLM